ncbi:MAG: DEAD/DEAH box helicase [Planctomycetes bacterium]|nr:DEAD/DEAH box helicase [Planctomycetota bacterium]
MLDAFHPTLAAWFRATLGEPTAPQREGWPRIQAGSHTLIAAPTGSGKTLAAFLWALDRLLRQGPALERRTAVLYVSPLKALSNDVQQNLLGPLHALRALDPALPEVAVLVRTGDTPAHQRQKMGKEPPHVLVTTPESLFLLLTSRSGRRMLADVRTVIVDEIHALARDKRGSHLALSLERLERLVGSAGGTLQRIGLSATQRPIAETAALLAGAGRECAIVDGGHLRRFDLAVEVPDAPLSTVCSDELWGGIYARMVELIAAHRTTLVFVNTRKMAERVAARLQEQLGPEQVTSHHGSLSRERRLDAERRLKGGTLRALVATASLELGIDVGEVELVIQVGPTASIATLLQRVGRAGHGPERVPRARVFPLHRDDLLASAGLMLAVRRGELDRTEQPVAPLDILAQQVVAAAAVETLAEDELFALCRRAWPYRALARQDFDAVLALHARGRAALLHRDGVGGRVRGTRRAALTALTSGGAIPDNADWRVVLDPQDVPVGTVHEDFAIESSVGDVFQLGNASWQIRGIGSGTLRVVDAKGAPPSLPFWIAEGPARSAELAAHVAEVRAHGADEAWLARECGLAPTAAGQLAEYLRAGRAALGAMPTQDQLVLERFFDETGGQQLVVHSPFGSRVNRALGLALRKRFCTGFGFELQAAANEDAVLISLGPMHSFALAEVWSFLQPETARDLLVQAMLPAPMFQARWRWNVTRALLVERHRGGRRVPPALLRMRADDALAAAFPQALACPETLPPGPLPVPMEHPIVAQTVRDVLHEAMDAERFLALLRRIRSRGIALHEVETSQPSPFAEGVLHAMPYGFLDDAPLEERRTQAVLRAQRGAPAAEAAGTALDPEAVARVRAECWPDPRDAEEVHETLLWMGWVGGAEAEPWRPWLDQLAAAGRVVSADGRWYATETVPDPVALWRGRLEAVGPVVLAGLDAADRAALAQVEAEGTALRARLDGCEVLCHRRLLARIRARSLERLRRSIEPVSQIAFAEFRRRWQHVDTSTQLDGPRGVAEVLRQMAGLEFAPEEWEDAILRARVREYRREWLDQLTLSGEFAWLRLTAPFGGPVSRCGIALVPREELEAWLALAAPRRSVPALGGPAQQLRELLDARGALFPNELRERSRLLPSWFEEGLAELVRAGLATCDSFAALRQLAVAPSLRRFPVHAVGRWSPIPEAAPARDEGPEIDLAARRLLARHGVVAYAVAQEERGLVPWRLLLRALRAMELRGEVRGGRFVAGFGGEHFATEEAVAELRRDRREARVAAQGADPERSADS